MKRSSRIDSLLLAIILCPTAGASIAFHDPAGVGLDMAIDHAGNVYFAGAPSSDPNTTYHDVTVKYDNKGNKVWEQGYQGPVHGAGWCNAIALDQRGNAYVTGHTFIRQRVNWSDDTVFGYMTVKYDPNGKQLWKAVYDEPEKVLHSPDGIGVASNGDVYVIGELDRPDRRVDPNDGQNIEPILRWEPDSDIVIIKYGAKGKQLWTVRYGDEPNHLATPYGLAVGRDGSVYMTADSAVDKGTKGMDFYASVIKYNMHGKQEWVAQFSGEPNTTTTLNALTVDVERNVYIAGSSSSYHGIDYADFVTTKYDTNGKQQWLTRHRITGKMSAFPSAITVDGARNVCVTGWSMPRTTGPGYPPRDLPSALKRSQVVTFKYDANGKQLWTATYKEPEKGVCSRDLMIDAKGNIYIIGEDALVIEYDGHGNQKWARWFKNAAELAKFLGSLKR